MTTKAPAKAPAKASSRGAAATIAAAEEAVFDLEAAANALVANLPNPTTITAVAAGAPVPAPEAAKTATTATFVGARSAELALVILDPEFFADATAATPLVQISDIVFPALEAASEIFGTGVLGDAVTADVSSLFDDEESVIFELTSATGTAGWFLLRLRADAAAPIAKGSIEGRLSRINEVEMALTVEIGRTRLPIREVLGLEVGTVVELDRAVGAPADILLNGRLIAHGEVVVVEQEFAVRITRILDSTQAGAR
jgi:flagellar motor switch protein FliN/FliY